MYELKKGVASYIFLMFFGLILLFIGGYGATKNWVLLINALIGLALIFIAIKHLRSRRILVADSQGFWCNGRNFRWDEIAWAKVEKRHTYERRSLRGRIKFADFFVFHTTRGETCELDLSFRNHSTKKFVEGINYCAGAEVISYQAYQQESKPLDSKLIGYLILFFLAIILILILENTK